jgi:DNA polymerase-3 subunit delta
MSAVLTALDFLAEKTPAAAPGFCVVFGDEPFLKRLVLTELRHRVLGAEGGDGEFALTTFDGDAAEAREVFDCLSTMSLFGGGQRLVIIDDADEFVSGNRPRLEDYISHTIPGSVLVLEVSTWPSNTRLYKKVVELGLPVNCETPATAALLKWLIARAKQTHQAKLERDAAELLLETVGPQLGLLDQELAKLASAAGLDGTITAQMVTDLVGGWRAKTTWDMLDAAAEGKAAEALVQLDRLLLSGENPIALLAQIGSTLRRFAAATRLVEQAESTGHRVDLRQALQTAGFKTWPAAMQKAESQLRQLGRERGAKLYHWLLEADLALKGSSSHISRARTVLEQLVVRMSQAAAPKKTPATARK